ncbi:hypothetical protein FZC84_22180 [Rossellomorea vietnamensis]|uniref:Permease n=1 Tax=Rossellomorea vietnamensis TaxID=218284 RepID=A0A5D4M0Q2_9BACI|nr:hypothetical protein [Rossellomorea vietnamensis]TYR94853.1 hypothetical protein FZC84_22180 [Rossellomorea vietnamensis]
MKQRKEPIKSKKVWTIIISIFLLSVPWYLPVGSSYIILGAPYWGWLVVIASLAMSVYLTYVLKHEWEIHDDKAEGDL